MTEKFHKKKKSAGKKTWLLFLVFVLFFILGNECFAQTYYDPFTYAINPDITWGTPASSDGSWILWAIQAVLTWILNLVVKLMSLAVWFLDMMMTPELYTKILTMDAISQGWKLVRDFLNMFFILIILFVAISTILRIEKYDARKMLYRIILAALLINFSKPIALFFIDVSQLAMGFFMNNINSQFASYTTTLAGETKLSKILEVASAKGGSQVQVVVSTIFAIIFFFIFAIMIFILACGLFLRIIAFMTLIVISPLAFFGLALPGTPLGGSWDSWLKKMTNWGFFGPVLLFFLWLALLVMSEVDVSSIVGSSGKAGVDGLLFDVVAMFIPYVFAIYLLWYGYDTAGKMAKDAGQSASKLWNKGEKWLTDWGKRAGYATAAVGTLGVAPGLYYGGRSLGRGARDYVKSEAGAIKKGIKKRFGVDDQKKKDREEEREARFAGGDDLIRYRQKKSNEQVKEWEDKGAPTREEQARITNSGSDVERMALAMHRAKNGELRTQEAYDEAIQWAGNDRTTAGKIRSLAEKKNLASVLESDLQAIPNLANDQEMQLAMRENASLRRIVNEENEQRRANGLNEMTDAESLTHLRDIERGAHPGYSQYYDLEHAVYGSRIKNMSFSDMRDQDVSFFTNDNVHTAIEDSINRNPARAAEKRNELRTYAHRNLTEAKMQALDDAGLL